MFPAMPNKFQAPIQIHCLCLSYRIRAEIKCMRIRTESDVREIQCSCILSIYLS